MMEQEDAFSNVQTQPLLTILLASAIITPLIALFLVRIILSAQQTLIIAGEILITIAVPISALLFPGIPMEIMRPRPAQPTAQQDPMQITIRERGHASQSVLGTMMLRGL